MCLVLFGCSTAPTPPAPDPLELRTWELPPGYATRLVGSLQRVLGEEGRATEGPGGALVVVAPEGVLDGVDHLVTRTTSAAPARRPQNVELEYWVVRGVPAAESFRGPGLDPLATVLDTIVQTDGPMALSLVASRRLRTLDGDRGEVADETLRISQVVGIEPGGRTVVADVLVAVPRAAEVQTRLALESGTVAVLSQAGFPAAEGPSSLYLLVRPAILE